jgi:hypothetical protein
MGRATPVVSLTRRASGEPAARAARKLIGETDPIRRLQTWADADRDRYFEIRYIAEAPHPWAVELSNDSVSWSVVADAHSTLELAVDYALKDAAKEEP